MSNSESRRKAARQRHRAIRSKSPPLDSDSGGLCFVADVMLGRLAKWLRIAGFDVLYSNRYTDEELVRISRGQDRVLLSRDTRLLIQKSVRRFIYLESDDVREQIRQVFDLTRTTDLPGLLSRCLGCNRLLEPVEREQVKESIPPFVYRTQLQFKSCPSCRKIYWAGTHRQAVLRTLQSLLPAPPAHTA